MTTVTQIELGLGLAPSRPTSTVERAGYDRVKRCVDVALVLGSAPLWVPLLTLLCGVVAVDSRGWPIFRHGRVGRGGHPFRLLKLRSMHLGAEAQLDAHLADCARCSADWQQVGKLRADPRLTRVGRWLRQTSLDELPQLFNVLRGEMALVGPRPLPWSEVERYGRTIAHYAATRPGLTGLWQVSGRNALPYAQKPALDERYVRGRGFWLDTKVLLRTVGAVLSRRGAY